jgi:hypothetical protein
MALKHHPLTLRLDPRLVQDVKRIARARSWSEDRDVSVNQLAAEALARLVRAEGTEVAAPLTKE